MKQILASLLLLFALSGPVFAQSVPGTLTQQSSTSLMAATVCASLDGASGSATLTPPAGWSVYLTSVDIATGASGTISAVTPVKATSAGLTGSPTFGLFNTSALTVGQISTPIFMAWPSGLKGQTNTAVSVTGAATTNMVWHITICGYYAQ